MRGETAVPAVWVAGLYRRQNVIPVPTWVGKWQGGRILQTKGGVRAYVIERMVKGRRYSVALEAPTLDRALLELRAFNVDPVGYLRTTKPLAPTWDAIPGFARALADHMPEYVRATLAKVEWWRKRLRGRPLEQ